MRAAVLPTFRIGDATVVVQGRLLCLAGHDCALLYWELGDGVIPQLQIRDRRNRLPRLWQARLGVCCHGLGEGTGILQELPQRSL